MASAFHPWVLRHPSASPPDNLRIVLELETVLLVGSPIRKVAGFPPKAEPGALAQRCEPEIHGSNTGPQLVVVTGTTVALNIHWNDKALAGAIFDQPI
jgi:hypothetical protein